MLVSIIQSCFFYKLSVSLKDTKLFLREERRSGREHQGNNSSRFLNLFSTTYFILSKYLVDENLLGSRAGCQQMHLCHNSVSAICWWRQRSTVESFGKSRSVDFKKGLQYYSWLRGILRHHFHFHFLSHNDETCLRVCIQQTCFLMFGEQHLLAGKSHYNAVLSHSLPLSKNFSFSILQFWLYLD